MIMIVAYNSAYRRIFLDIIELKYLNFYPTYTIKHLQNGSISARPASTFVVKNLIWFGSSKLKIRKIEHLKKGTSVYWIIGIK